MRSLPPSFCATWNRKRCCATTPRHAAGPGDSRQIAALQVSDNVVALLAQKTHELPDPTRALLGRVACIGDRIAVQTVATAENLPAMQVAETLWPAAQAGLLLPLDDGYETTTGLPMHYRFAHDRVHQACYESLSPAQRQVEHLRIGRRLHQTHQALAQKQEEWVFDVIGHLNRGSDLITDAAELVALMQLNLAAGLEAKRAAAYAQACAFFAQAQALATPHLTA